MPKLISLFIVFFCCLTGFGQVGDCTLGIGGKDNATLAEVFQLNDDQKAKMEIWTQELSIENKLLQDEIDLLMKTHPQKTEEELMQLAGKYKTLQDKMVVNAKSYDIKLLRLFNPKQYKLYTELCAEVMRTPLLGILPE
ncbi:hypothetical protein [Eudoraea chungangensis]|uniref:hypothetical protein n=1 Tax=Eudoraea chungangensis TaxID=1481905 RepID=UPI0023ED3E15|nr:hypothetical protein [Eudoraea chungangensis]